MSIQFIVEHYPSNNMPKDFEGAKYDDCLRDYIKEYKCDTKAAAEVLAASLLEKDYFNNINLFMNIEGESVEECSWEIGECFNWHSIEGALVAA